MKRLCESPYGAELAELLDARYPRSAPLIASFVKRYSYANK